MRSLVIDIFIFKKHKFKYLCVSIHSLLARKGAAVSDGDMPRQRYILSELRKAHYLHHVALGAET